MNKIKEYGDWCWAICNAPSHVAEFRCPICGALLMLSRSATYMRVTTMSTRYHRLARHLAETGHSPESVEDAAMAALLGSQGVQW